MSGRTRTLCDTSFVPTLVFDDADPTQGYASEHECLTALAAEMTATLATGEAVMKEAPRRARRTPMVLLLRLLDGKSPQYVELVRAVLLELAEAVLVATRALLAAPPLHQRAPASIAPAPLPVVRGSPIRSNAPPAQQFMRCCRALMF